MSDVIAISFLFTDPADREQHYNDINLELFLVRYLPYFYLWFCLDQFIRGLSGFLAATFTS